MKFSELNTTAKNNAIIDYIKGWKETHPNETLTPKEAMDCCFDSEDDVEYNENGEIENGD